MKIIANTKTIQENFHALDTLISPLLKDFKDNSNESKQKRLEICHVGKFLMLLGSHSCIEKLSEKPDFILNVDQTHIGLEHQIIINPSDKQQEGFFENIFSIAEERIQGINQLPNFHANCYLHDNIKYSVAKRDEYIAEILDVIITYVSSNQLKCSYLIQDMHTMPHDRKSISPNFGAWWQKRITERIILEAIARKESKIESYMSNCGEIQWLLLVIGGVNDSSYEMDQSLDIKLESRFSKIYIMEDFNNRLFEIK